MFLELRASEPTGINPERSSDLQIDAREVPFVAGTSRISTQTLKPILRKVRGVRRPNKSGVGGTTLLNSSDRAGQPSSARARIGPDNSDPPVLGATGRHLGLDLVDLEFLLVRPFD